MKEDKWRVLLVDSNQDSREPLATFLRENGDFEVDTATNRAEGWARVQWPAYYDVVLIDEMLSPTAGIMPQRIGIDLMKEIKAYSSSLEIILFRPQGAPSSLEAVLHAGAFRYLDKLSDRDELVVLIKYTAETKKLRKDAREKVILTRLMETNAILLGAQSEHEVLTAILHGIQDLEFDRVRLYKFDGQCMYGIAHVGMDDDFLRLVRPVDNDADMQQLLRERRPHVHKRMQGVGIPFENQLKKEDVYEWICFPLTP